MAYWFYLNSILFNSTNWVWVWVWVWDWHWSLQCLTGIKIGQSRLSVASLAPTSRVVTSSSRSKLSQSAGWKGKHLQHDRQFTQVKNRKSKWKILLDLRPPVYVKSNHHSTATATATEAAAATTTMKFHSDWGNTSKLLARIKLSSRSLVDCTNTTRVVNSPHDLWIALHFSSVSQSE